jgi:hypothetical protein
MKKLAGDVEIGGGRSSTWGGEAMKVMVLMKASEPSEAGRRPSPTLLHKMLRFNEELVKSGIMLAGHGLQPGTQGKRLRLTGGQRPLVESPLAPTSDPVAGFWLWQVRSMDEAVAWAQLIPGLEGETAEVELRPVQELAPAARPATMKARW